MTSGRNTSVWLLLIIVAICFVTKPVDTPVSAQNQASYKATIAIRLDQPGPVINRNIYGQFAEHLGRLIYEGLWVGEGSPIPNTRGLRNDVVTALKELHVPLLRWPGGCFADEYHWRDGIGPRDKRPRRPNASWGGVDSNAFGTHEFMELCDMLGAEAYINGNVGSGTPQEMMEWIEYMTSDSDSDLANQRRRNGREKPWKVPYFAVGNETWGCGGNMRPEFYADVYRQYATFIKNHSGNRIQKLAVGAYDNNYNWTEVLMSQAAKHMDGLSLHYYTLPTGNWDKKGSATEFGESEWHTTLARTLRMEEYIQKHSAIMDKHDPQKRVGLMVDEWGTWYDREPGRDMGALYQQNTLRDAIVAGVNFNIFHKYADRVRMTNIAQMVNVLQAMVLTDKEKMVLTPTYHVFRMYRAHQGATMVPVELSTPQYTLGAASVPSLSVSASRDGEGRLHLSIVNLDPSRAAEISTTGAQFDNVKGEVLTAPAMNAMNTFDSPNSVKPVPFNGHKRQGSQLILNIPAKSVVVLELASQKPVTLKDAFKNDFMIGAALNRRQFFEEDTRGAEIVRTHFNSITPENVLKWGLVHPELNRYDFTAPDRLVEFGERHGMFIVGHTLVWHNQTPRWVFENEKGQPLDRETLLKRLRDHIFTVVGRYKGRIKGWDVVNEALNQDGTMRQSPWFKIIGDDYLVKAFEFAREADPAAELYYNDYDLELPAKRAGAVELLKKLKASGVSLAGVGLQNHSLMEWPSVADVDATITAFANLGLKVHITELDVDVLPRTTKPGADYAVDVKVTPQLNPYLDGLPDARQSALAKRYAELFQVFRKHRGVIERVTFWGVADGDSWLNNWPMRGRTNYPLLFDRSGKPKPALAAVIDTAAGR